MRLARWPGDTREHRYPDAEEMRQVLRLVSATAARPPARRPAAQPRARCPRRGAAPRAGRAAAPFASSSTCSTWLRTASIVPGTHIESSFSSGLRCRSSTSRRPCSNRSETARATAATSLAASGDLRASEICFRRFLTCANNGASRARTGDLLAASQTLSQLSYGPWVSEIVARPSRLRRRPRGRRPRGPRADRRRGSRA